MPGILRILLLCSLFPAITLAQTPPKRELRGAWVATYLNIDWPNRSQTPAQQRAAFIAIADHHRATGLNALYVQVRSQCDAMYASELEPWSADLTGTQGNAPSSPWDPMAFAIEECHKRGMEFHAWINPYRAVGNANNLPGFAASHVAKAHPEWLLSQGTLRVLDPGLPPVRDHISAVIADILHRYDVDGIHFDDYFYPPNAPAGTAPYNDSATFADYPRGFTVKADWRRDNVNLLIQRVYDSVKTIKPWVKFGVSPSGIYRNSTNPDIGSPTGGLEHYTTLYADTKRWLQEGWVDYIMPQVYWWIGQPGANYGVIVPWWNNQSAGRHIYIGIAGYKMGDAAAGAGWTDSTQIPRQIRMNRSHANVYGQSVYNTTSLRVNTRKGFRDSLRLFMYAKPALLPAMQWRDSIAPAAPFGLNAVQAGDDVQLFWWHNGDPGDQLNRARQFAVYRSTTPVIDTSSMDQFLAVTPVDSVSYTDTSALPGITYYYAVTALDRYHNESPRSGLAANLAPTIQGPGNQWLFGDADCGAPLPDYRDSVTLDNPEGVVVTQYPVPGSRVRHNDNVYFIATNAGGKSDTAMLTIGLKDTLPPVFTEIVPSPGLLNTPNNKMVTVALNYTATDCGPVTRTVTVTSNEPDNGSADWQVVDANTVKLRAQRNPLGNGRVYTITVTATDTSGNSSVETAYVLVPGNKPWTHGNGLAATVLPNPTFHQFVLMLVSKSQQPIGIRVYNSAGALVETRQGQAPNSSVTLGSNYLPGIYYIEISQANIRQLLKVIKLGH
ncbi:family 10 glycosylhydrolase [Chitinophaga sp.]|uniref:family 10 glycosylhydrolase n=1 Tax=Chitinophaga sp. TaxID=1869181 RepID=UPI00263683EC|nr:family 10 glycosylhydrolase [uncultured Chitinophaga sp.]